MRPRFLDGQPFLRADRPGAFPDGLDSRSVDGALWAVFEAARGQPRPFASFGNPIFLGTALASAVPVAVSRPYEAGQRRDRLVWGAAAVLQSAGLMLSHSRAAAFGLLSALILWSFARLSGRRLVYALGAAAAWAFRGREWTHALIWRDALALWRAHPVLGCGLGRFHLEFPAFASEALRARWPQGRVIVNFAHNEYLQTFVETGPLGLAAAAGALTVFAAAFVSPDLRFGASDFAAFVLLAASSPTVAHGAAPAVIIPACARLVFFFLAVQAPLAVRRNSREANFHTGADQASLREAAARLARSPQDADAAEELGSASAAASRTARAS